MVTERGPGGSGVPHHGRAGTSPATRPAAPASGHGHAGAIPRVSWELPVRPGAFRRRRVLAYTPQPAVRSRPCAAIRIAAGMAEPVDALDSKSSTGDSVRVRVSLPAPTLRSLARHARRRLDPRAPPASTALRSARIGAGRGRPAVASIRTLPTSIPRPPSADGGTPPALPPPARREVRGDLALRVRHAFRTPVCRNLRAAPAFSERATGSGSAGRRGRSSAACRTGGRSRRRRGRSRSPRR